MPTLESERLVLRPMEESDAPDVVRWRNDPRISGVSESRGEGKVYTVDGQLQWFRETRNERIDYVVIVKDVKRPIGVWSFKKYHAETFSKSMEQGRLIGEQWALGQGYAKEAAAKWTEFGFDYLRLDAIFALHKTANLVPRKINLALGFEVCENAKDKDGSWITLILTSERYHR